MTPNNTLYPTRPPAIVPGVDNDQMPSFLHISSLGLSRLVDFEASQRIFLCARDISIEKGMSRTTLRLDGLWARTHPQFSPTTAQKRSNPILQHITAVRKHSSSPSQVQQLPTSSNSNPVRSKASTRDFKYAHHIFKPTDDGGEWRGPPLVPTLSARPNKEERLRELEEKLNRAAELSDLPLVIHRLRQLISQYREKPSPKHYRSWILGTCDHRHGTAVTLRQIWEEVIAENLPLGPDVFHAFIKVRCYCYYPESY